MSLELKKQINNFLQNKQSTQDMYTMFCKISKRKDLQRQIKRFGKKSYNIRHVKNAVIKFIKLNPEYDSNKTEVTNLVIDGEFSGSGMLLKTKDSGNYSSVPTETKSEKKYIESDKPTKDSGNDSLVPAETNKKYSDEDIIVRIKKRLADISNERSFLQGEILKIGKNNDAKSISIRKKQLDIIKAIGDEYDVLFKAKEDYFKTGILPDISVLKIKEPEAVTVVKALGYRNNIRSQISRAKNKSKSLSGDLLIAQNKKIEYLQREHDKYQAIIDNAS